MQSLVPRTIFFTTVMVKYEEKNLDITKPCYREHILPISWSFVISTFFCSYFTITGVKKIVRCTKDWVKWKFVKSRFHCTLNQRILLLTSVTLYPLGFCILDVISGKTFSLEPDITHKYLAEYYCLADYGSCRFYLQHRVSVHVSWPT